MKIVVKPQLMMVIKYPASTPKMTRSWVLPAVGTHGEICTRPGVLILSTCQLLLLLSVLTAIAAINEAIENENSTQLIEKMNSHSAGLTSVDESYCNRYLSHLISVKEEKAQVGQKVWKMKCWACCNVSVGLCPCVKFHWSNRNHTWIIMYPDMKAFFTSFISTSVEIKCESDCLFSLSSQLRNFYNPGTISLINFSSLVGVMVIHYLTLLFHF